MTLVDRTSDTKGPFPVTRVIGYVRVSTSEQAQSGAGLDAQRAAIRAECERRGWTLLAVQEDAAASGRTMNGRPGLANAVERLERHEADALVVSKLDRLSRSLLDFASLMERSRRKGWALVALDLGVDTSTASGEAMASVLATFAQLERRLIGERTRDALAVKRQNGVRLGRPPVLDRRLVRRIVRLRRSGATLAGIADRLNREGVSTAHGGERWRHSSVRAVVVAAGLSGRVGVACW